MSVAQQVASLQKNLQQQHPHWQIIVIEKTQSTNTDLLSDVRTNGLSQSKVLIALEQQSGRGRLGRPWLSNSESLTFSLAFAFEKSLLELQGLSIVVGTAVARALNQYALQKPVQLKWPNDLYIAGRKLGGVLIETFQIPRSQKIIAVIGIGVNRIMSKEEALQIDQSIIDLNSVVQNLPTKQMILDDVLQNLKTSIDEFITQGFGPFVQRFVANCMHYQQRISFMQHDKMHQGLCLGINDKAELLLQGTDERVLTFNQGQLTIALPWLFSS